MVLQYGLELVTRALKGRPTVSCVFRYGYSRVSHICIERGSIARPQWSLVLAPLIGCMMERENVLSSVVVTISLLRYRATHSSTRGGSSGRRSVAQKAKGKEGGRVAPGDITGEDITVRRAGGGGVGVQRSRQGSVQVPQGEDARGEGQDRAHEGAAGTAVADGFVADPVLLACERERRERCRVDRRPGTLGGPERGILPTA